MITEKEYYLTTIQLVSDDILIPLAESDDELVYWILANDMFSYSTSDADPVEGITHFALNELNRDYGSAGIIAWLSHVRKTNPLSERMDDDFVVARKAIRSGEFEPLINSEVSPAVDPADIAFVLAAKDLLWLRSQKVIDFIILSPDENDPHTRQFEAEMALGELRIYLFFTAALVDKTCRHKDIFLTDGLPGLKREFIEKRKLPPLIAE